MWVEFYGLKFDLPNDWADITDDLPGGSPPSLARPLGAGTVQFSIAKYRGGEEPNVNIGDLRNLIEDFCHRNRMDCNDITDCSERLLSVKAASIADGELILARYFSNGKDILLATYVCPEVDNLEVGEDLTGVEQIMNSIEL